MKIIIENLSSGLKHIQYDGNDSVELKNRFTALKPETIDKLCDWLTKNNTVIDAKDCYDPQSSWHGTNFYIGKADLSFNGYCLRNSSVELFLNGGQDPMWYSMSDPEFKKAQQWNEANNPTTPTT